MFRFEPKTKPLLPRRLFFIRMARHGAFAGGLIFAALGIGVCGYHLTEGLGWLDSLLNASMILSGMGPVSDLKTVAGKLFASFYALGSGVLFITLIGVLLAPAMHRLMHTFHLEIADKPDKKAKH